MKICVAQTRPSKGDIAANIARHQEFTELASSLHANAIFFPELSLTGYEPRLAGGLVTTYDDRRLDNLEQLSADLGITICVGLPTKSVAGILISMVIFQPYAPRVSYSKQRLHRDELAYFTPGDRQVIVEVAGSVIVPAICYESLQACHSEKASQLGADVYVATVAKSVHGVAKARVHYPDVASEYHIPVLMANCVGYCDDFPAAGNTAVWNNRGELVAELGSKKEGRLIFDTASEEVVKQLL